MQSVYLALVYLAILVLGAAAPFAFSLGYVWIDVFSPQQIASSLLNEAPLSLIMAAAAFGSYLLADRKAPPAPSAISILTLLLAIWVTVTMLWAVAPEAAWEKWNWAFKSLMVSAFLPFVFRSRVQIEAFLLVMTLSLAGHIIPFGVKNFLSGGGYGINLGLIRGNSGIAEGSTFAGLCAMVVPLMLYFKDHGVILPRTRPIRVMWWVLVVLAVSAVIATYERTGLIALAVLGAHVWLTSKRKALVGGCLAAAVVVASGLLAASYANRVSTIGDYASDSSAFGRILVWRWTLGFVADHPLGGGFSAYVIDELSEPLADGTILTIHGKAFHSIFFEVLGEQGFPGIAIFISLIVLSFSSFLSVLKTARQAPGLGWSRALAAQLVGSLAIFLVSGLFVSNAFQPELPYLFASAACLRAHVRRASAETESLKPAQEAWRRRMGAPSSAAARRPASRILS